jgi:hypothetical protein
MAGYDYDGGYDALYEFVPVESDPAGSPVPPEYREKILIHVVHDGDRIPQRFRCNPDGSPRIDPEVLDRHHVHQRDWGANRFARALASALGIPGFHRVRLARALLDFNRFPGSTPISVHDPLDRLAINPPFSVVLGHDDKLALLEQYYDAISSQMEQALHGKLITITVHTYDEHNASLTQRPDVSLINRCASYQHESRMPFGVFDPMYPDVLGESTCSRILENRVSLNLERNGFRVGHNHPYLLPEGSIEVRTQVWYFFSYLRRRFEKAFPGTRGEPSYDMVWNMLLNTNLRTAEAELLRGYLHRFRRVTSDKVGRFQAARAAYEQVQRYLAESQALDAYRVSIERPSSMAMEVRKDLLCEFDPESQIPLRARDDIAERIARVFAGAVTLYLETDREIEAGHGGSAVGLI